MSHEVIHGTASRLNVTRGNRDRCHAVVGVPDGYSGNHLCHLPIYRDGAGWRHETTAELIARGITWDVQR